MRAQRGVHGRIKGKFVQGSGFRDQGVQMLDSFREFWGLGSGFGGLFLGLECIGASGLGCSAHEVRCVFEPRTGRPRRHRRI